MEGRDPQYDDRRTAEDRRAGAQLRLPADERLATERRRGGERRDRPRLPVSLWIHEVDGERISYHQTGNLSEHGMYFLSPFGCAQGTTITLELEIPGTCRVIRCRGRVMSDHPDGLYRGISLRFTDMISQDREALQDAVEDLLGERWLFGDLGQRGLRALPR